MGKPNKKSFQPLILILLGGTLLLGALLVGLYRPTGSQEAVSSTIQVANGSEIARILPEEAKAAFDSGEATFVDVRPQENYTESHIPGALSIPLDDLQDRMDELDQKDWIILY